MSQVLSRGTLDNFIKKNNLADESLINFLKDANYGTKDLASYQQYLKDISKATSTFAKITKKAGTVLKSFGAALGSMAVNWVISEVIGLAVQAIDDYIHYAENAKKVTDEFLEEFKTSKDTLSEHKKLVEDVAERYEELSKGVNLKTNENVSLTADEYQEFLDINKQLSETFPSIQSGITENAGSILKIGENGKISKENLEELLKQEEEISNFRVAEDLSENFKGIVVYTEEAIAAQNEYNESLEKTNNSLERINELIQKGIPTSPTNGGFLFSGDITDFDLTEYKNVLQSAANKLFKEMSDERRTYLYGQGITESTIFQEQRDDLTGTFELYLNTFGLDYKDIDKLREEINKSLDDTNISGIISDRINKEEQELLTTVNQAKGVWADFLPALLSGMKSKGTYKLLGEGFLGEDMQEIATYFVENMDYTFAKTINDYDPTDPYAYIRDKIITPINNLSQKDRVSLQKTFEKLISFDMSSMKVADAKKQLDKIITDFATYTGQSEDDLKLLIGFEIDETGYNNVLNELEDKGDSFSRQVANAFTIDELSIIQTTDIDWAEILKLDKISEVIDAIKQEISRLLSDDTIDIDTAKTRVNSFKEEFEALKTVVADTTNVSEESYESLIKYSDKYSTAISRQNGKIKINETKLKQVAKARQADTEEVIKHTIQLKQQEWMQWQLDISNYNDQLLSSIETKYGDIDALQQEITSYQLLAQELENCSSAFDDFNNAMQTDNQEQYDTAQSAYDVIKGTLTGKTASGQDYDNFGKYNTDEFREAIKAFATPEQYKKLLRAGIEGAKTGDQTEYQNIVKEVVDKYKPFFDEDNANSINALMDRVREIGEKGDLPKLDTDWADTLGISVDVFEALKQLANLYDLDGAEFFRSYDSNHLAELTTQTQKLTDAEQAYQEVMSDTSASENDKIEAQINLEKAQSEHQKFLNDTLNEAMEYAEQYQSDASFGGNFKDWLFNQGLESSDIEGITLALYEQEKQIYDTADAIRDTEGKTKYLDLQKDKLEKINKYLNSVGTSYEELADKQEKASKSSNIQEGISIKDYTNISSLDAYNKGKEKLESQKFDLQGKLLNASSVEEVNTIISQINSVNDALSQLQRPVKIEIESNINEINNQLEKLNQVDTTKFTNAGQYYSHQGKVQNLQNQKADLENKLTELQASVTLEVDDSALDDLEAKVKVTEADTTIFNRIKPNIKVYVKEVDDSLLKNKKFVINVTPKATGSVIPSGKSNTGVPGEANGTFNAFANGTAKNVSIPKNEKALVNELGEEGIVRDGKLIPIRGGAQLINLKRGDIIFNHKQMEDLKKHGYTSGRGKLVSSAYVNGTLNGVNAYADATEVTLTTIKKSQETNNALKKAGKSISDTVKDSADDIKEETEEVFDWIERRINNFQRQVDKWLKQAETTVNKLLIETYYSSEKTQLSNLATTYAQAFTRYMKEADASGATDDYKKKVAEGIIDIEKIKNDKLKEQINNYKENFDKAQEALQSLVDTAEKLYNIPIEKATKKIELLNSAIETLEKQIDVAIGSVNKNNLIKSQITQQKSILDAQQKAKTGSDKNYSSALSALKSQLNSSKKIKSAGLSTADFNKIKASYSAGEEVDLTLFNSKKKKNEKYLLELKEKNNSILPLEEYNGASTKIKHKCKKCSYEWDLTPSHALSGGGCPKCSNSYGEKSIINHLDKLNINYDFQKKFNDCKDKKPLPFDFYLPDYNKCIEYDGKQHFEPIEFFGGEKSFLITKRHDKIKDEYCENNGISLLRIPYYKYDKIEEELNNFLLI